MSETTTPSAKPEPLLAPVACRSKPLQPAQLQSVLLAFLARIPAVHLEEIEHAAFLAGQAACRISTWPQARAIRHLEGVVQAAIEAIPERDQCAITRVIQGAAC